MTSIIVGSRARRRTPTQTSQALFEAKAVAFRARRSLIEFGRAPVSWAALLTPARSAP